MRSRFSPWLVLALVLVPAVAVAAGLDQLPALAPGALPGLVGGLVGGVVGSWRVNGRTLTRAATRAARRVLQLHEARHHIGG